MPRGLNYDNKILSIVNVAVDMLILGIFWFVTSIPLVTIGASTTAVYYTVNKCIRNKKSYAYVEYWKAFKSNFKKSTLAFIVWLIPAAFLVADCMLMKQQLKAGTYLGMMYYFFLVLSGAVLAWAFYLFSYMARFECAVKEALKKSLFMMLANLGWSILLVAVFFIHTVLVQGHAMAGCAVSGRFWMYKKLLSGACVQEIHDTGGYRKRA